MNKTAQVFFLAPCSRYSIFSLSSSLIRTLLQLLTFSIIKRVTQTPCIHHPGSGRAFPVIHDRKLLAFMRTMENTNIFRKSQSQKSCAALPFPQDHDGLFSISSFSCLSYFLLRQHSFDCRRCPIGRIGNTDTGLRAAGMYDLAITDIQRHMVDRSAFCIEDQVARLSIRQ